MDLPSALFLAVNLLLLLVNVYTLLPVILAAFFGRGERRARPTGPTAGSPLPRITLLLPAYREGGNLRRCVDGIRRMDYPPEKMALILATAVEDIETSKLAKDLAASPPGGVQTKCVTVKQTPEPRGKPRALNQALEQATGEIIGVLDAEDVVDPGLCREVARSICEYGFDGVQGVLDMANDYDGWLNAQFRAEYGYWYNAYLPGLKAAGYPLPFGGTTNFFKAEALRELEAWDSFNLTEDFDLGMRFYAAGKKVGLLASTTREESPSSLRAWLRQRTRWQRGKIQSLRKVMRRGGGGKGAKRGRTLHMLMSCLVPHVGVLNLAGIALTAYFLLARIGVSPAYDGLWLPNLLTIGVLCYLHAGGYLTATRHEYVEGRLRRALLTGVTLPAYWVLHWAADLRAMKQEFVDRRIFWEKTEHSMRHMGVQGFYRLSGLLPVLRKSGFKARAGGKVAGRSGTLHRFDLFGTYAGTSLVVHGLEAPQEVGEGEVAEFVAAARDSGADQVLLVASPGLSRGALKLAKGFGLSVIETRNLNYSVRLSLPPLGDFLPGRKP